VLVACKHCDRKFAEDRIAKHKVINSPAPKVCNHCSRQEICKKTSGKDVKPVDFREKRLDGTEAEQFKVRGGEGGSVFSHGPHVV
jgi:hypothetical protein